MDSVAPFCPACEGIGTFLGALGRRLFFCCRYCGLDFSILEGEANDQGNQ